MQKTRAELLDLFAQQVADWLIRFPAEAGSIRERVCAALKFTADEFRAWVAATQGKAAVAALEAHVAAVETAQNTDFAASNSATLGEENRAGVGGADFEEVPFEELNEEEQPDSGASEGVNKAHKRVARTGAAAWLDNDFEEMLHNVSSKSGSARAAAVEFLFTQIVMNLKGRNAATEALVRERVCDRLDEIKKADYERCLREAKAKLATSDDLSAQDAAADGDSTDWGGLARKFLGFLGSDRALIRWRQTWYEWTRVSGYYQEKSDEWMDGQARLWMMEQGHNIDDRAVRNFIGAVRATSFVDDVVRPPCWRAGIDGKTRCEGKVYLSMRNGILDLESVRFESDAGEVDGDRILHAPLIPHTPDFFTLNSLPYDFDSNAKCPQLEKALEQWQPAGEHDPERLGQRTLQDFAGYVLEPGQPHQVMLLNHGPGSDGKSQYKDVLTAIAGIDNTTTLGLEALDPQNVNGREDLLSKTLWTVPDANQIEKLGEGTLKAITGGDRICISRKFKRAINGVVQAKVMLNCNEMPGFRDRSEGIWRRLLMLEWHPITENIILGFGQRLIETEMSGIFNWALRGWRRVRECGFVKRGVIVENVLRFRREIQHELAFIDECVEVMIDPDWQPTESEVVTMDKIMAEYMNWCKCRNIKAYSHPEPMGRALAKMARLHLEGLGWTKQEVADFVAEKNFIRKRTDEGKRRIRYYVKIRILAADVVEDRTIGEQYGATRSAPPRTSLLS